MNLRDAMPKEPGTFVSPCVVVENTDFFIDYTNVIVVPLTHDGNASALFIAIDPTAENNCRIDATLYPRTSLHIRVSVSIVRLILILPQSNLRVSGRRSLFASMPHER